jgi:predicted dehydrogenase
MAELNFGVIGAGRFGRHYVRLLKEILGVKLAAVAGKTQGNAEAVLADPGIDCIVIASPASTHFEYIIKALAAGKHILVEKPMVLSIAEAEDIKEPVKASGKVFMVAHQYLYNNAVLYLQQQIKAGVLGKIEQVNIEHLYPGPIREDVGVFWDAAPHEFAILDLLLGPVFIKTAVGKKKYIAGEPVEDYVEADAEFSNGTKLNLTLSSNSPIKTRKRVFIGEKGSAIFDDSDNNNFLQILTGGQDVRPQIEASEPLLNELLHFIGCVQGNKLPFTDIEHGLRVVKNMESVYRHLDAAA